MGLYYGGKRMPFCMVLHCITLVLLLTGCSSMSLAPYASTNFRAGKMAILPFDNLSTAQGAAKAMENFVLVEFLKITNLTVVEPGTVGASLSEERVRLATNISRETLVKLGAALGVDLIMIGVVNEYQMQRLSGASGSGETPVLSVSVRILDAKTGGIVWAVNASRSGNDAETIFGMGRIQSMHELAAVTAASLAESCADSLQE